jgi:hypothetical protein
MLYLDSYLDKLLDGGFSPNSLFLSFRKDIESPGNVPSAWASASCFKDTIHVVVTHPVTLPIPFSFGPQHRCHRTSRRSRMDCMSRPPTATTHGPWCHATLTNTVHHRTMATYPPRFLGLRDFWRRSLDFKYLFKYK